MQGQEKCSGTLIQIPIPFVIFLLTIKRTKIPLSLSYIFRHYSITTIIIMTIILRGKLAKGEREHKHNQLAGNMNWWDMTTSDPLMMCLEDRIYLNIYKKFNIVLIQSIIFFTSLFYFYPFLSFIFFFYTFFFLVSCYIFIFIFIHTYT